MSGYFLVGGAPAVPGAGNNLNNSYEYWGYGANGEGTTLTGTTQNVRVPFVTVVTATANIWKGFYIDFLHGSASTSRFLVTVRLNGTTTLLNNLYLDLPGGGVSTVGPQRMFFPINIPAGTSIEVAMQSSTTNGSIKFTITGVLKNANSLPLFNSCDVLGNPVAATGLAGSTDIPVTGAWTTLVASTGVEYGAFHFIPGTNGTSPATAQSCFVSFGVGASPVEFARVPMGLTTTGALYRTGASMLLSTTIPSGSQLSVRCVTTTPGTDMFRAQLLAYY